MMNINIWAITRKIASKWQFRELSRPIRQLRLASHSSSPVSAAEITSPQVSSESSSLIHESLRKYMRWYPQDEATNGTILSYMELSRNAHHTQNLLVGIVYENSNIKALSKLLEALLADPLASGSKTWFRNLESRPRDVNNIISFSSEDLVESLLPEEFQRSTNRITAHSPILSADYRSEFGGVFEPIDSKPNDLVFLEINNDDDVLNLVDSCHFFIYVSSELSTLMDAIPRQIQKKILVAAVDNPEYSPLSSESSPVTFDMNNNVTHHGVKIDSIKMVQGVHGYLARGSKAGSEYFDDLQDSNILELYKLVLWFLRTENLKQWLLLVIREEIIQNTLLEQYIRNVHDDLHLHTVTECSSSMHAELQKDFIPTTNNFFRRKLRWWMLYWKNDNVEYALKDYFMSHFMPKSISAYNFVKGQLVARLEEQKYAKYPDTFDVSNPLEAFKQKLINERVLVEVQLVVYASIMSAFVYYQLPLTLLSVLGYGWFGIQAKTAVAVTSLGWILGFNQVSKQWHDFSNKWLSQLYEEVRLVISNGCIDNGLLKELNVRYEAASNLARIKTEVVQALNKAK